MAKKRKHSAPAKSGPREVDPRDGKLTIRTFEDVADEEDEFHLNRDKVMLDDGPDAKRRRRIRNEDAQLEQSDEEILGYDEDSSEEDDDAQDDVAVANGRELYSDAEPGEEDENDGTGDWGTSRKDYYNNDNVETEADALEEEAEAKRLQQKKLQKMSDADFGFDENEWLDTAKDEEDDDAITEVLKDVEITKDMDTDQRLQLLTARYPEFEFLANDYIRLQPLLAVLQIMGSSKVAQVKLQALTAYLAAISMYFAVLTSTSQDNNVLATAISPIELRDHGIMESLLQCRELWSSVKDVEFDIEDDVEEDSQSILDRDEALSASDTDAANVLRSTKMKNTQLTREAPADRAARTRLARIEASKGDLEELQEFKLKATRKKPKSAKQRVIEADDHSDFGEEESLSTREMAEKAQKKKSLRFYTSQIAQKANRRADAGRDAGGDADLPYRERLRDRQARLNAEAEKRGKKLDEYGRGAALDGESEEDGEADSATAVAVRDGEDDYYNMVSQTASKRKTDKADRYAAIAEAKASGATVRFVDGEVGEDGKRAISYQIQKNAGLTPKRGKDVRNPRVKKRKKYEEKLKKLNSMKSVYKGGEGRGGYGGEKTGIKTGLVKSVKL